MHDAKTGLVAHLEAFAGNTIEFIRSESPLLIDGIGIPDIDVDVYRRHVVVVVRRARRRGRPQGAQAVHQGVPAGAGRRRAPARTSCAKCGYRPQLIVGNPDQMSAEVLKCGAQVVLPADADGHASGLERIQDLGIGAMTFPAAGSAADLALLLVDHHGASLIVTAGHSASIEEFFDRSASAEQPVDVPDPAQGRREARRRQSRCDAVPQPHLRRRDRDAGPGGAVRHHRRTVGLARPTPWSSTGSRPTGTASRCGFRAG